jgi:hypothetical protein
MRMLLLAAMAYHLGACGGTASDGEPDASDGAPDTSDSEPSVIHTGEVCKVESDCKMDPGRSFCRDSKTAVRYEIPQCGADQRCAWTRLEDKCDLVCEDGYCISAVGR